MSIRIYSEIPKYVYTLLVGAVSNRTMNTGSVNQRYEPLLGFPGKPNLLSLG